VPLPVPVPVPRPSPFTPPQQSLSGLLPNSEFQRTVTSVPVVYDKEEVRKARLARFCAPHQQ
jgi:hypothetical protein